MEGTDSTITAAEIVSMMTIAGDAMMIGVMIVGGGSGHLHLAQAARRIGPCRSVA